ncbi:MAG: hypothetical protein LBC68_05440 [Prevotellaceae bacterium]|nr:hypothetical protein [Prevotellaceae bacterium]
MNRIILCYYQRTDLPVEYGKYQRLADTVGTFAGRTASTTKQCCHHTEIADKQPKPPQTVE